MKPTRILLATGNPHKADELRQMLHDRPIEVMTLKDLPDALRDGEPDEDQPTLEGNALKKALFWHERTGLAVIADDTGLEVDALGGAPGVWSARYAGPDATYADNVTKLLKELRAGGWHTSGGATSSMPAARFRTVVACIEADGQRHLFEGVCEGAIVPEPRGSMGFGYDPVFQPEGSDLTFAQMEADEKNAISHRGRAMEEFTRWLLDPAR